MPFVQDAVLIAHDEMRRVHHGLANPFAQVVTFLVRYPELAPAPRGRNAPEIGSTAYVRRLAAQFAESRDPRAPQRPTTVPDPMVSVILRAYFDMSEAAAVRAREEHQLAMGAENLVGDLLERYLATVLEPLGWIWCSGSVVRSIDFLRPPAHARASWSMLQIKNRDNSENSSSSRVRDGTDIDKWFRTFARTGATNWTAFPDPAARRHLSEEGFTRFVERYLPGVRELR